MNRYVPILQENLSRAQYELEELVDREGALVLVLANNDGQRVRLKFDSHLAFRKMDEGDALATLAAMRRSGGTGKYFYRVDESEFVAWFNSERYGAAPGQPLIHYAIAAQNDIVDVLSIRAPSIEFL